MLSDPIADMLTRIRNATAARHTTVEVPSSNMKVAIATILVREGYLKSYEVMEDGVKKTMRITLKYGRTKHEKVIAGIKRISKPGLRVYANCEDLPKVLNGLGLAIVSTNKGVLTDREAGQYLGHVTTVLLDDGKTIFCVYPKGHGRSAIVYKKSFDGRENVVGSIADTAQTELYRT